MMRRAECGSGPGRHLGTGVCSRKFGARKHQRYVPARAQIQPDPEHQATRKARPSIHVGFDFSPASYTGTFWRRPFFQRHPGLVIPQCCINTRPGFRSSFDHRTNFPRTTVYSGGEGCAVGQNDGCEQETNLPHVIVPYDVRHCREN
jgi:hypothetical protein